MHGNPRAGDGVLTYLRDTVLAAGREPTMRTIRLAREFLALALLAPLAAAPAQSV